MPAVARGADVTRTLIVFNDTFAGTSVTVAWEIRAGSATGAPSSMGTFTAEVPLGSRITRPITIRTPATGNACVLWLRAQKNGATVFEDDGQVMTLN
jgi:hypothetical protein